jgi:hypothetical protein
MGNYSLFGRIRSVLSSGGQSMVTLDRLLSSNVRFVAQFSDETKSLPSRSRAAAGGDHRRQYRVFLVLGAGQAALIVLGKIRPPSTPSLFYLGIIVAMGYELSTQALRAAQLAPDLRASEQQIAL